MNGVGFGFGFGFGNNLHTQGGVLNGFCLENIIASQPEYRTLLIDSENVIWSTSGDSNHYSGKLYRSTNFTDYTEILTFGSPYKINTCFELADGELLLNVNIQSGLTLSNCGIFKTTDNRTGITQVIQPHNDLVRFAGSWGISIYRNIVIISEYGGFAVLDEDRGSRYLYYSDDYGSTFTIILDLMNAPVGLFPTEDGWELAHMHCCNYDHIHDRIWISTGDGDNSKIVAWTDDLGVTWQSINLNNYFEDNVKVQLISMASVDTGVICGTDSVNGGIILIDRKVNKADLPTLSYIYNYNIYGITNLTGIMRQYLPTEPLIIPVGRGDHVPDNENERYSYILAYNGSRIWKMWQDEFQSYFPYDSLAIHRLNNQLVFELDNMKYATGDLPDKLCRYIGDLRGAKDLSPTNLQLSFDVDTITSSLSFNDNSNEKLRHQVYRSINDIDYAHITTLDEGVTTYSDSSCPQGVTVYYKVRAISELSATNYLSGNISIPLCFKTDQSTLNSVRFANLNVDAGKKIIINWGDGGTQEVMGNNANLTKNYINIGQYNIAISGDVSFIKSLQLAANIKIKGDISNWVLPNLVSSYAVGGTAMSGKFDTWIIPATCYSVVVEYMAYMTGGLPQIAPNPGNGLFISIRNCKLSYSNITSFRPYMTKLDLQAQGVAFLTTEIDKLFLALADYYETHAPQANCTFNTSGANMGIPTGGNDNVDIVRLKGYYTAAGFTATVTVRTS